MGKNPLPAFLAAVAVMPQRLTLLASEGPGGTREVAERLRVVFEIDGGIGAIDVLEVPTVDFVATRDAVRARMLDASGASYVCYAGGTQPMAVGAVLGLQSVLGVDVDVAERCLYVSEQDSVLTTRDGTARAPQPAGRGRSGAVARGARHPARASDDRDDAPEAHGPGGVPTAPRIRRGRLHERSRKARPDQSAALGEHLERILAACVSQLGAQQVEQGLKVISLGQDVLEADAVFRHRFRVGVISCSVSRDENLVYERELSVTKSGVAIGGSRAAVAAVGMRHSTEKRTDTKHKLRSVASVRAQLEVSAERAPVTVTIFGCEDVLQVLQALNPKWQPVALTDAERVKAMRATTIGAWATHTMRIGAGK